MPAYSNNLSSLDKIRLSNGGEALKSYFHNLADKDEEQAVSAVNEKNLLYPSLFLLQAEISKYGLHNKLNQQNRQALDITNGILTNNLSLSDNVPDEQKKSIHAALNWMLETGYPDDGLNDQFDEVMDVGAIILIKIFKDKSHLKTMQEMIFNRNKKGAFIHDLVWAFFEAQNPESLIPVADRLRSGNWKDIELAKRLLGFIPGLEGNANSDLNSQHSAAVRWFKENQPYLYFTGDSMQQSTRPMHYAVSMESKYLNKNLSDNRGNPGGSLTEDESEIIGKFNSLNEEDRLLLADCSYALRRRNMRQWRSWLNYPLERQIVMAKAIMGGLS